ASSFATAPGARLSAEAVPSSLGSPSRPARGSSISTVFLRFVLAGHRHLTGGGTTAKARATAEINRSRPFLLPCSDFAAPDQFEQSKKGRDYQRAVRDVVE